MNWRSIWRDWRATLGFLALMLVFRSAVADWNHVPSSSMNPTLVAGDRVLVNKLAYSLRLPFTTVHLQHWAQPQRGDVITFDSPADEANLIKRVVAVPGDWVAMRDNVLWINGEKTQRVRQGLRNVPTEVGPLELEVWQEQLPTDSAPATLTHDVAQWPAQNVWRDFAAVRVPQGQVFVLGDSRDNSRDSRFIGMIDQERITGRAERVVLSLDAQRAYLPRADRWWLPLSY